MTEQRDHTMLGVQPATFRLTDSFMPDVMGSVTVQQHLAHIAGELVDLTTYRPPAFSWRNNTRTLVLRVRQTDTEKLLCLGMMLLRCGPREYQHFLADDGMAYIRMWWDS